MNWAAKEAVLDVMIDGRHRTLTDLAHKITEFDSKEIMVALNHLSRRAILHRDHAHRIKIWSLSK
jgi:hypothetical protein